MSAIKYDDIVTVLLEKFPEYKSSEDFSIFGEEDMELPYIIWGSFCQYAVKRFNENSPADPVVTRLFAFVNDQFSNPESEHKVLELLTIEIFENFAQEEASLAYARAHTTGNARKSLEESMWWTGIDAPDASISPEAAVERQKIMFGNKYSKNDPYQKKILGIRNYKSDKKEFGVQDLCDVGTLERFLEEVSTGESDITPAGKSFLEEYFGLHNLSVLLLKRGKLNDSFGAKDAAGIFKRLKNVEPMGTRVFIEEARGTIKPRAAFRNDLLPPGGEARRSLSPTGWFLLLWCIGAVLFYLYLAYWLPIRAERKAARVVEQLNGRVLPLVEAEGVRYYRNMDTCKAIAYGTEDGLRYAGNCGPSSVDGVSRVEFSSADNHRFDALSATLSDIGGERMWLIDDEHPIVYRPEQAMWKYETIGTAFHVECFFCRTRYLYTEDSRSIPPDIEYEIWYMPINEHWYRIDQDWN